LLQEHAGYDRLWKLNPEYVTDANIDEPRRIAWWQDDNLNTLPVGWAVEITAKQTIQNNSVSQSIPDK
jgi:hypothetical protein